MEGTSERKRWSWLEHWLTSIFVSIGFLLLLALLHAETAVFHDLEQAEADAAMRLYSSHPANFKTDGLRVVLVTLDNPPSLSNLPGKLNLTKTLATVLSANPKAVAIDVILHDLAFKAEAAEFNSGKELQSAKDCPGKPDSAPRSAMFLCVVATRLNASIPVILPEINQTGGSVDWKKRFGDTVRWASPNLGPDSDGLVRVVRNRVTPVPGSTVDTSFAAAMVQGPAGSGYSFDSQAKSWPILFAPVDGWGTTHKAGSITIMPAASVALHPEALTAAYVVLGVADAGDTTDTFVTPIGLLPGALVHAQAVRTLAWQTEILPEIHPAPILGPDRPRLTAAFKMAVEFGVSICVGAIVSLYPVFVFRYENTSDDDFKVVFYNFIVHGVVTLCGLAALSIIVAVFNTWLSGLYVDRGIVFGSVTYIAGSMLEAFVHAGKDIVTFAEFFARRIVGRLRLIIHGRVRNIFVVIFTRRTIQAFIVVICLPPVLASAKDCTSNAKITAGRPDGVSIEPGHTGFRDGGPVAVEAFQQIVVKSAGTRVLLDQTMGDDHTLSEIDGINRFTVPPCPPGEQGLTGAWHAFWSVLNPTGGSPMRSAATPAYRAFGSAPPIVGPLHKITGLNPASGVVAGAPGVALVWAGGAPPYDVTLKDGATGAPLKVTQVKRPTLWLPDLTAPTQPFEIAIRDADDAELHWQLQPLPAPTIADGELADAVLLFESAPDYRLEALRRIFVRASDGDVTAARAVQAIQLLDAGG